jgi:simple sugar transport system substrate-binding protein
MKRLRSGLVLAALVTAAVLALAACGGSSKSSSSASGSASKSASSSGTTQAVNIASSGRPCTGQTFAVITHGDNGSFWSVVYKGAKNAAADYGCKLSEVYGSQQQGQAEPDDNAENAQINDAINAHVNGIVVSDHDSALMNPTLAKAAKAGIPVVLANAGCDPADIAASHALACVGQPEQLAGQTSGQRFKQLGADNVLCVIHQSGQNLLDRCNGIAQGLGVGSTCKSGSAPAKGPACTQLTLSTPNAASNPQQAVGQVTSYLQSHPGINAVMTLNNAIGTAVVASHPNNIKVATFDTNAEVLNDIKSGSMSFVVDQQQYLQGYLPIVMLYLYAKHEGNTVGAGTSVPTGPLLVDKTNVAKVQAAIAAGDD